MTSCRFRLSALQVILAPMEIDFEKLVESDADYLFRYASRHFPNADVAEDLVQESFLAAIEAAPRFKGESTLRTWMVSILRHKIIDRIRKKGREVMSPDEGDVETYFKPFFNEKGHWREEKGPRPIFNTPEASLSEKEFMEVLQGCLNKLPSRLRHVFLLREIDGISPEEICSELELSPTNLRVMLHRCRVQLRDCLEMNWLKKIGGGSK